MRLSKIYHDHLVESVRKITEKYSEDEIAILFSGGVDSLCILLSFLELGKKPALLYTLQLKDRHSQDARAAIRSARLFDVPHRIITLWQDHPGELLAYVKRFILKYQLKRKAKIETLVPFTMMFEKIRNPTFELEKNINCYLVGFGADDLIGSSKTMSIRSKQEPEFYNRERKKILNWSQKVEMPILNSIAGKTVLDPFYESKELQDFMLSQFTRWAQLNKPYPKWIMKYAFQKYFKTYPFLWRRKINMQTESGIREWFQQCLKTDSVVKLYNKIYNEFCDQRVLVKDHLV